MPLSRAKCQRGGDVGVEDSGVEPFAGGGWRSPLLLSCRVLPVIPGLRAGVAKRLLHWDDILHQTR